MSPTIRRIVMCATCEEPYLMVGKEWAFKSDWRRCGACDSMHAAAKHEAMAITARRRAREKRASQERGLALAKRHGVPAEEPQVPDQTTRLA